ncbi:hypothetical protein [Streptomyces sp. NBC_00154]|uniref:hypothetical protein n=1 Tax=Streptomyces sp. NBC_00154 TaxID=2975670 RepID=UPI0022537FCE|nr:hypothetical protein [Streptomyces sp. NBC_00154]MCX5318032.1 hypothetical protein [Streptomyces sp. NBC_00154]
MIKPDDPGTRRGPAYGRRTAVGLALGAVLAGGLASAPAAEAAPTGSVCMFKFPYSIDDKALAGHVAWAFQTAPDRWIFGSYSTKPWSKSSWTGRDMVNNFKKQGYDGYRCKKTHQRLSSTATTTWKKLRGTEYRLWTNNCLTVSLAVFRSYSRELRSLPTPTAGTNKLPRTYYDKTLPKYGFGVNVRLK